MRVIFMGTTEFSKVVLQELVDQSYDLVAVVTQPDRPFGRKRELKAPVTKVFALENKIEVIQPNNIKNAIEEINALNADLIVTCAYGQIIPVEILNHPKHKAVNFHASLLPKYRGGAPIHWSIINGDKITGMTLMEMAKGMDTGAIISQEKVSIDPTDTMGDVEKKMMEASRLLIQKDLKPYLDGKIKAVEQDKDQVSFAYNIQKEEEIINFDQDVEKVYDHIRGLIPWPVSYALLEGDRVKFHGATMIKQDVFEEPGTILSVDNEGLDIATQNGIVRITKIQPFGRPAMSSTDFMNGFGETWKGKVFS